MKRSLPAAVIIAAFLLLCSCSASTKELVGLKEGGGNNGFFYKNPIGGITGIGDPYILKASDGRYYLYATSMAYGFKVWSSDDLIDWKDEGACYISDEKAWGLDSYWAPEVVEYNQKYYMYYTASLTDSGSLRIGAAVSDSPLGPFIDADDKPLFDYGWASIDSHVFFDDDGRKYLYFVRDCSENVVEGRHESHIYVVELADDMLSVKGEAVRIAAPDQEWEKKSGDWLWNEGPNVLKREGKYYLIYSANFYGSRDYSLGYAVADNVFGPYTKYDKNPVLFAHREDISGPGHNSVTTTKNGEYLCVYHTHTDVNAGGGNRQLFIDRMGFRKDGSIYINGPTITFQPRFGMVNIGKKAEVKGVKNAEVLIDGEVSVNRYLAGTGIELNDTSQEIRLVWDKPETVSKVFIYGSPDNAVKTATLEVITDGGYAKELKMPEKGGDALIIEFEPVKTKSLVVRRMDKGTQPVVLSEVEVF